jgi:hypothetical protein
VPTEQKLSASGGWTLALQILGASAAIATFVVFIGGVMMWLRFDAIDLPADRAVALLPRSDLLATGAHSLAAPILIGLVVVLLISLIEPLDDDKPTIQLYVVIGLLFVIASIVVFLKVKGLDLIPYAVVMYLALATGVVVVIGTAHRTKGFRPLAWTLFAAFGLLAGLLAVVTTAGSPKLEPVAIVFKADTPTGTPLVGRVQGMSGFLVGETSDKLYLAPLPGSGDLADPFADADLDRIVEIPRESVIRLAIRAPAGVHPDEAGREQAQALFQDLRLQVVAAKPAKAVPVTTDHPVETFAPLVNLHSHEAAWPMNVSTFLAHAALIWVHPGSCPDYVAALDQHIADPASATQAYGKVDPAKLGAGGYVHYASDPSCRDLTSRPFTTAEHTRPSDADGRPAGLPLDQGFSLDLANSARGGEHRVSQEGPQDVLTGVHAYYERHPDSTGGARAQRITYWFFYGLSVPPGLSGATAEFDHEADWERISVLIKPGPGANQWIPISARYHFHDQSRDVPWTAVRTVADGPGPLTHPLVYSARGSHASYPRAGSYAAKLRVGSTGIVTVGDDAIACPRCPVWRTWQLLTDAQQEPWYGYGGAWGAVGTRSGTIGPLGPSAFKTKGQDQVAEKTVETVRESP